MIVIVNALQAYNIIIDIGINVPRYGRKVVDILNNTKKVYHKVNLRCATYWF